MQLIIELKIYMQGGGKTLQLDEDISEFFDGGLNPFQMRLEFETVVKI